MLNEGFCNTLLIDESKPPATPHIDFGYSDALIESVVKAISKIDSLTETYETKGIHSGITDEERRLYYDLKVIVGGLQYGLTGFTNNLILQAVQKKYDDVKKKEEKECCPFCGRVVEE